MLFYLNNVVVIFSNIWLLLLLLLLLILLLSTKSLSNLIGIVYKAKGEFEKEKNLCMFISLLSHLRRESSVQITLIWAFFQFVLKIIKVNAILKLDKKKTNKEDYFKAS